MTDVTVPPPPTAIRVRPATRADAPAVAEVGIAAWRATYAGIVGDDTVERFIAGAYTVARIESRIERDVMFVAEYEGGDPSGVDETNRGRLGRSVAYERTKSNMPASGSTGSAGHDGAVPAGSRGAS